MNQVQKSVLVPWEKYQRLIKQIPSNKDPTTKMHPPMVQEEPEDDDALSVDRVIEAVPKNVQNRVCALLSHVTNDGRLTWNRQGEICYEGQTIPGSHITDLVKDSQYKYKHFNPTGYHIFYTALKDMNIPKGLIGHRERVDISQAKKTPPGITEPQAKKKKAPIKWLKF